MSHTLARRFTIAALSLPLFLAGCADDDEPVPKIPKPTAAPTSVASTSEAPVEPTLPPEAEGTGIKAAEAFVRHYYSMVNYAQATGDTTGLAKLGLQTCRACGGGKEFIDQIYERGGTNSGGEYTVVSTEPTGRRTVSSSVEYVYLSVVTKHPRQEVSGAGDMNAVYEAGKSTQSFELVRDPSGWHIASWKVI